MNNDIIIVRKNIRNEPIFTSQIMFNKIIKWRGFTIVLIDWKESGKMRVNNQKMLKTTIPFDQRNDTITIRFMHTDRQAEMIREKQ